jgi:hypothetical protein
MFLLPASMNTFAQTANYDESKVPKYTLPNALITENGDSVSSVQMWQMVRKSELIHLFEENVYGKNPTIQLKTVFSVISVDYNALNGLATRKQIEIKLGKDEKSLILNLLIYLPNNSLTPAPAFLGFNFYGNQTINKDTGIIITKAWVHNNKEFGITKNIATPASRGVREHRWPVPLILEHGYALATVYYGDIDPDYDDGFQNGIHPLFYKKGQNKPAPDEWGSIGAWALGYSLALDYLTKDQEIDEDKVIVMGHSRLGKAALWAGALDPRFALVISNESGCGGAALSRRQFGETVKRINTSFPHWFCENFKKFNSNEHALPVDQHELIALVAPRPVYVTAAADDLWADPEGMFQACKHASPVFELFGEKGIPDDAIMITGKPVNKGTIWFHQRSGKHDVTNYDWKQFIKFADKYLK